MRAFYIAMLFGAICAVLAIAMDIPIWLGAIIGFVVGMPILGKMK